MQKRKYLDDVPKEIQDLILDGETEKAFVRIKTEEGWSNTEVDNEIERITPLIYAANPSFEKPMHSVRDVQSGKTIEVDSTCARQEEKGAKKRIYLEDVPREIQDLIFNGSLVCAIQKVELLYKCSASEAEKKIGLISIRLNEINQAPPNNKNATTGDHKGTLFIGLALSMIVVVSAFLFARGINPFNSNDSVTVFMNNTEVFHDFINDDRVAEAIWNSPEVRKTLEENVNIAAKLSPSTIWDVQTPKSKTKATRTIAVLYNDTDEFRAFFCDARVARRLVEYQGWNLTIQHNLIMLDMNKEIEKLRYELRKAEGLKGLR